MLISTTVKKTVNEDSDDKLKVPLVASLLLPEFTVEYLVIDRGYGRSNPNENSDVLLEIRTVWDVGHKLCLTPKWGSGVQGTAILYWGSRAWTPSIKLQCLGLSLEHQDLH